MYPYNLLAEMVQQERQQEAERERLVRLAEACNPGRPFYAPALGWLGGLMTDWGQSLESQFLATVPAASQATPPCD